MSMVLPTAVRRLTSGYIDVIIAWMVDSPRKSERQHRASTPHHCLYCLYNEHVSRGKTNKTRNTHERIFGAGGLWCAAHENVTEVSQVQQHMQPAKRAMSPAKPNLSLIHHGRVRHHEGSLTILDTYVLRRVSTTCSVKLESKEKALV